jgi:predicted PurR-regulated permease PerM
MPVSRPIGRADHDQRKELTVATPQAEHSRTDLADTARRIAISALVILGIAVVSVGIWKLRLVVALVFLGFVLAAAMRPGIESLTRRRVPQSIGVAIHYLAIVGLVALFAWLVVPRALGQVEAALGVTSVPTSADDLSQATRNSTGVQHEILVALQKRLRDLPSASKLVRPGLEIGAKAFEVVIGVFFVFATAAYWIFERDRTIGFVCSLIPRPKRKLVRDTWILIDLKLGAFVRGQLLLVAIVAVVLSLAFWAIGEPYWILLGAFAGVVEIIPVIGPLAAGGLAVGVGLTVSTTVAILAAAVVLGVRLLEDYLVVPRVLGDAVGLTPLVVLVSVTSVGILFGGFAVILAIPIAACASTLIDVIIRNRDPAEEEVPTVLFSASDSET